MVFSKGVELVNKIVRPSYLILWGGGKSCFSISRLLGATGSH